MITLGLFLFLLMRRLISRGYFWWCWTEWELVYDQAWSKHVWLRDGIASKTRLLSQLGLTILPGDVFLTWVVLVKGLRLLLALALDGFNGFHLGLLLVLLSFKSSAGYDRLDRLNLGCIFYSIDIWRGLVFEIVRRWCVHLFQLHLCHCFQS